MKKETLIAGVIGLIIGAVLTGGVMASQSNKSTTISSNNLETTQVNPTSPDSMNDMDHDNISMDQMSMADMMAELDGKTGDEFDRTFIQAMIAHHQGAIEMANMAKQNAKNQEIKDLSDDIISAQNTEINQMMQWQKDWGYTQ